MEFRNQTLKNGLQVVAECNPRAYSTGLGFFVRTGSRDETDKVAGVSHFLEHMVFKGTPSRTADDVNRQFDEMGAHYNAFTSEENTVYYAAVLPESQEDCIELLTDIMRPSLREDDFNTEKQVILEEIRMYDDQPPYGADDKCKEAFFGDHPLARSVLGTVATITDLTAEQMREYFTRRYSPGNLVLGAAGRVDFDALVNQAERLTGAWKPHKTGRDTPRAATREGVHVLHRPTSKQQYVLQMSAGPAATDDDRFPAKVLATILGDDSGSRFYWELIDPGLAEHASLGHGEYDGTGIMMSYMSCDPPHAAANLQRMQAIYADVERDGITKGELSLAKNKIASRIVLGSERPKSRLFSVGGNWLHRAEYRSVQDDLASVEAVTVDDIATLLAKYPLSTNTTMAIGPLEKLQ